MKLRYPLYYVHSEKVERNILVKKITLDLFVEVGLLEEAREYIGIELHSRSIPPLALQQTGSRSFAKDHDEVGMWPLSWQHWHQSRLCGARGLQPLVASDKWTDGYLISTSHPSAQTLPITLNSIYPLIAQYNRWCRKHGCTACLKYGWQSWSGTGSFTSNSVDYDPPSHLMRLLTQTHQTCSQQKGQFVPKSSL